MSHIKRISFLIRTKNKSLSVPFFTNQINYCVHARSLIRTNTKSFMIRGGASPVHCCQMTAMTTMISWDFHCKLMLIRELKPWRSTYDISGILAGSATGCSSTRNDFEINHPPAICVCIHTWSSIWIDRGVYQLWDGSIGRWNKTDCRY